MKKGKKKRSAGKTLLKVLLITSATAVFLLVFLNIYVYFSVKGRIVKGPDEYKKLPEDVDVIMVLGASVVNGEPSHMLADRLDKAIELYKKKCSGILLMSGDNGQSDYNEVAAMQKYAEKQGVPPEAIYTDHAGFSTYESIYRAAEIFDIKSMIIVTQEYHLYRALYIAEKFNIDAYGAAPEYKDYVGDTQREIREILARIKDFVYCIIKPEPTYLGDKVRIK